MLEKDLLTGLLSVQTQKNAEEIASLIYNEDGSLKEDALNQLKSIDADRVSKLQKESFDSGVKKTQATLLDKREREIRERFQIESDKTGLDLIDDIINSKKEVVEVKGDITEADIEKHPVHLTALEQKQKEFEDYRQQVENERKQLELQREMQQTFSVVESKALELLRSTPIIIEEDKIVAQNRINLFINDLKGANYQIQEDRILLLNNEGELIKDAHGNRVDFNEHLLNKLKNHFAFKKTEERTSSGTTTSNTTFKGAIPKNDEEYSAAILDKSKTLEERLAIKEAYYKSKA